MPGVPAATLDPSIDDQVREMFRRVAAGITAATAAFVDADLDAARQLVAEDLLIDELQERIEARVEARLLDGTVRDPLEVRSLIAVLRIVPELERTGDLVEHIALRTPQRLAAELTPSCRSLLQEMGTIAAEMWRLAADAFSDADPSAAHRLRVRDDTLDDLHVSLTSQLATGGTSTAIAIEMGLVARFYERLGDHAVNVTRRLDGGPLTT